MIVSRCGLHDQCRRVFAPSLLSTGLGLLSQQANDCNFPVSTILLAFINDHEGELLHEATRMKPPIVDHCMVRSWLQYLRWLKLTGTYSAFAFFLSGVCRIFRVGVTALVTFLVSPPAYLCAQTPRRGVEP